MYVCKYIYTLLLLYTHVYIKCKQKLLSCIGSSLILNYLCGSLKHSPFSSSCMFRVTSVQNRHIKPTKTLKTLSKLITD